MGSMRRGSVIGPMNFIRKPHWGLVEDQPAGRPERTCQRVPAEQLLEESVGKTLGAVKPFEKQISEALFAVGEEGGGQAPAEEQTLPGGEDSLGDQDMHLDWRERGRAPSERARRACAGNLRRLRTGERRYDIADTGDQDGGNPSSDVRRCEP